MARKALVGMFLLGALIVFALATFYIENWQFYLKEGYRLKASFPGAQSLDEGDPVRLAGVSVGRVAELRVDTETESEQPAKAVLWINSNVLVRSEDVAVIKITSIFGGNYVAIEPGDRTAPVLKDGDTIRHTVVAPSIPEVIDNTRQALTQITDTFRSIDEIAANLKDGQGTFGKLLADEEAYQDLKAALQEGRGAFEEVRALARQAREGGGVLAKLLSDQELAESLEQMTADARELIASLQRVSADLEEGKGTLGKLLTDESLYGEVSAMTEDAGDAFASLKEIADKLQTGEGALARLITDDEMGEKLAGIISDASDAFAVFKDFAANIEGGTLGKLVYSDEAYEKLNRTLDDLSEGSRALAEGEGTLGKLVTDDELYGQITALMDGLSQMVNDYREQSPMITFVGALFGAF